MMDGKAIARSIFNNHPFFKYSGWQPFGWDWRTFGILYPRSAAILREALYNAL
jgi:hypothetical protein